jgi:hypothetical protein
LKEDNLDHLLLYEVLGYPREEGLKIDLYQNIGRFVFKYSGSMLEELTITLINKAKGGKPIAIPNTISSHPTNFHIDCYVPQDNKAHEIKWRDATTDGDHIKKEKTKLDAIVKAGYRPVRIMFFYPNRHQAKTIQDKIRELYLKNGEVYVTDKAWQYVASYTGVDLYAELMRRLPKRST